MDIDFSLVLVILVLICGLVALLDRVYLIKKRQLAVTQYQSSMNDAPHADRIQKLQQEPLWIEYSKSFFPVLLLVLLLRSFLLEPFTIPSGSMLPTLRVGDYILVNKYSYGLRLPVIGTKILTLGAPQRGDVMVFRYPENPRINYIKRVVGLPGDRIVYYNKKLTINGQPLHYKLIAQTLEKQVWQEQLGDVNHEIWNFRQIDLGIEGQWIVPVNQYFMMGDNRDNSRDSRVWGFVPDHNIVGKAFAVWMYKPKWIPSFDHNGFINAIHK